MKIEMSEKHIEYYCRLFNIKYSRLFCTRTIQYIQFITN
jgi:hypothetical protein